jgi:dolichol-phosphate mannosyltransferase
MLYFLIPAYNEESGIEQQIDSIRTFVTPKGLPFRIVIVDDGSTDGTVARIRGKDTQGDLTLLVQERNQGPARAFQAGFTNILSLAQDSDVVITLDADNTHNLRSVQFMLSRLSEGYDVVLGSCFATGGMLIGVPLMRRLLTVGASWLYRLCFPITGIKSYTGFYRAYTVSALRRANSIGSSGIESKNVIQRSRRSSGR